MVVLAAAVMYVVPVLVLGTGFSPAAAVVAAVLVGIAEHRRVQRQRPISDKVWTLVAASALILYTGALITGATPQNPGDWLAMTIVFAFPIVLLFQIYTRRVRGRRQPAERASGPRAS